MSDDANHMERHPENTRSVVHYDERYDEYLIVLSDLDGVVTGLTIYFCPWCGEKLPKSLRDKWFDELEALGIDPMRDEIPIKYRTSQWRSA